jgi:hypothetical protein
MPLARTTPTDASSATRTQRVTPPRTSNSAPTRTPPSPGGERFSEHLARAKRTPSGVAFTAVPLDATHAARPARSPSTDSQHAHEHPSSPCVTGNRLTPLERDVRRDDPSLLAPFLPLPTVLAAPPGVLTASTSARPSPSQEVAALAERVLRSLRVGHVGRHGHEVRLQLRLHARSDVEVRLRQVDGALEATVLAGTNDPTDVARLADAIRRELDARGVSCASFQVEAG